MGMLFELLLNKLGVAVPECPNTPDCSEIVCAECGEKYCATHASDKHEHIPCPWDEANGCVAWVCPCCMNAYCNSKNHSAYLDSGICDICGKRVCIYCYSHCEACNTHYCRCCEHACTICPTPDDTCEIVTCKFCGTTSCATHEDVEGIYCPDCGERVCGNCVVMCEDCNSSYCPDCVQVCTGCGWTICKMICVDNHQHNEEPECPGEGCESWICGSCGEEYCWQHDPEGHTCDCGVIACPDCQNWCDTCKRWYCNDCGTVCAKCGKLCCSNCTHECGITK